MLKRCLSGVKRHLVDAEASNDELHTKVRALETNILHLERLLSTTERERAITCTGFYYAFFFCHYSSSII